MNLDQLLVRHYTNELEHTQKTVYDLFEWHTLTVSLKDYSSGKTILHMSDLEFPTHFSQTACDIIASKYFRKSGVPSPTGSETSFKQIVHRMVSFWIASALDEKLIDDCQQAIIYDELAYMLIAQIWAPNSPQWFNTGLNLAYGIQGPCQGHYYYDEATQSTVLSQDAYTRTQGSACFILSVNDALLGGKSLTDQLITETRLFKYGSGVGSNWSNIRGKGELLSGGGKSSGLMSFLKVFDRNAGAIKSGGTTRRAAKMNVLNINHPEIESFINWKAHEEQKVDALGKMGYDTHFDGEAYETVSGQNVNNSVRVSDTFMKMTSDSMAQMDLINRLDQTISKQIHPHDLFDQIADAAWRCGDPGMQFDDTINSWHTCPAGENGDISDRANRINASNPCSEYMFLDDTACNLASINIIKFYDETSGAFDLESYLHCIKLIQIVLEATIHHGQFPTPDIARKSYHFRTTGLGLTNMGALFMLMGLPYDSEESRTVGASLMSILTGYSYYVSGLFAKKIGPFTYFDVNKPYMLQVMRNHSLCSGYNPDGDDFKNLHYNPPVISQEILHQVGFSNLAESLPEIWKDVLSVGESYGFRNAQVSVLAPTGTIAFAMDCATTSSEPFFSHVVYKKLVGGGTLEIVNPLIAQTLKKLNYSPDQITAIADGMLNKVLDTNGIPFLKKEHYAIFDTAQKSGLDNRYIAPSGHVKMMAALTPHVSGAISKTVNLPQDATTEDIKAIYKLSWELGIKAIALYRDGCKVSQPLTTSLTENRDATLDALSYQELLSYAKQIHPSHDLCRNKPTGIRHAHVHEAEIGGLKLYITVSFYDNGHIGELYVSAGRQGSLVKGLLDSLSTTISEMLQYGVSAQNISQMYRGQKFEPNGFVNGHPYIKMADSISDLISKIIDIELGDFTYCQVKPTNDLSHTSSDHHDYSTNQEHIIYGETCAICKSTHLVRNGTCKICQDCGTTTGCS
ncbi:MAG: vitamin B12-dependent ribonucleotide reductase [Cellulosilyticaceae bacterium]